MKKYQVIMPIALPVALAVSVVYMVKQRTETNYQYQSYMQAAADYEKNGIVEDAIASYQAALQIQPSLDGYLAIGTIYMDEQNYYEAETWYRDELAVNYPDDSRTYAFGIQAMMAQGNAREAFSIYDTAQERNLVDDSLRELMQPIWYSFDLVGDYTAVTGFSNTAGLAAVRYADNWGYVDTEGGRVVDYLYSQAGTFGEVAPVVDETGEAYFIDTAGNKKITASYFLEKDPEFGQIQQFLPVQSGLVAAYNGQIWNYYDASTYEKRFGGYAQATQITNGVGGVSQDGKKWALISQDGQLLTDFVYDEVVTDDKGVPCRTQALIVRQDGGYRLVDRAGQPVGSTVYEDACAFYDNNLAAVKKDGRWIFVSETGEETDLGDFEQVKSFAAGAAPAKQNGKWGYIDQEGTWIIEPQFEDAGTFNSSGVAFVQTEEEKWELLKLFRFHH